MATVGCVPEFEVSNPASWDLYAEQVKYFLEANSITDDDKKRATLLALCGIKTLSILRSLISPNSLSDKSYDELLNILKQHFSPRSSEIYRRFQFHKRTQQNTESVTSYVTELRRLANDCNFGGTLSERLRDQLVCGIRDEAVQRRLLSESELSLNDAISKALAAETSADQAKNIQSMAANRCSFPNTSVDKILGANKKPNSDHKSKATHHMNYGTCHGCGGQHERIYCKFKNSTCRFCQRTGHIEKVCRAKAISKDDKMPNVSRTVHKQFRKVNLTSDDMSDAFSSNSNYSINTIQQPSVADVKYKQNVNVCIDDRNCHMEIDSGSFYSIISYETFKKLFTSRKPIIRSTSVKLTDFQLNTIPLSGMCIVKVQLGSRTAELRLLISKNRCTSILGYEWFQPLGIQITGIHAIADNTIDKVLEDFKDVFDEKLGSYTGPAISLPIDPQFPPVCCKARMVPLAMKPKIDHALDKLLKDGVIEPISYPKWATPVVPIIKPSGEVRLCGDYKVTLNKAMKAHSYPIPAVNELLHSLKGGGFYSKIDLAQAYLQLHVDEKSAEAQTIITHKGAFKVKRLQYGINVAPGLFQNFIENLFSGMPGVIPYFDDVLIRGASLDELASRLLEVLKRLKETGLRAKKEKCFFGVTEVEFLGYRIDSSGIHPSKSKVDAIQNSPTPRDKQQLQAFLGLLNFYHSFLRNKATVAEPLHRLLQKDVPWKWTKLHDTSFNAVKELLTSESILIPFDEKLPITLTCDASPYGVGCVLSHVLPDGREAPVAFASRTLSSTERNYAQIDKEALSIIMGVKKFHNFLYGHQFRIITDHQPLLGLFRKTKSTPEILSPRMLRWSLILNAYDYELIHRPGKKIQNADALSRLPKEIPDSEIPPPYEVLFTEELPNPPLQASEVAKLTLRDPVMSRVLNWTLKGWSEDKPPNSEFHIYYRKRNELSVHKNCLLWGNRVVVPKHGRERILNELHIAHPGIERMKALARSYVWWPQIDRDIEYHVKDCEPCQNFKNAPSRAPVHPWEITEIPWSRIHVDYAGPFHGQYFLIVVDSFSKWLEVKRMPSMQASALVTTLREIFSVHGLPDTIVSDNGTQFSSVEFRSFLERNLIRQILISPYHPPSNGQAEKMVQTTKSALKKIIQGTWEKRLAVFLLNNHITPSCSTGFSPAELLMGRRLKSCLDFVHPDLTKDRRDKQESSTRRNWGNRRLRTFKNDDPVYIQNFSRGPRWVPAAVVSPTGPVSYRAVTPDGDVVRRHIDQMRDRHIPETPAVTSDKLVQSQEENLPENSPSLQAESPKTASQENLPEFSTPRRPKRDVRLPKHFRDFDMTWGEGV